jgi:hypothetical protein
MESTPVIDERSTVAFAAVDRESDDKHVVAGADNAYDTSRDPALTVHEQRDAVMINPLDIGELVFALPGKLERQILLTICQNVDAEGARPPHVLEEIGARSRDSSTSGGSTDRAVKALTVVPWARP